MDLKIIAPKALQGTVTLPASKSISNRVLVIRELMRADFGIDNLAECDDTEVLRRAFLSIKSAKNATIDINGSGTAMRFLTAMFAVTDGEFVLRGNNRMHERPIAPLVTALKTLGADIDYLAAEGFPPLKVCGHGLKGGRIDMPGHVSSQFASALLMVAPLLDNGLELHFTTPATSLSYIQMTIEMMRCFGADVAWTANDTIRVTPTPYIYNARSYSVEADWTSASYWFAMQLLCRDTDNRLSFSNLPSSSLQGDAIVPELFRRLRSSEPFEWDFASTPDLVQTIAVCCYALGKPFRFTGIDTLRIKETDRIAALEEELGMRIVPDADGTFITPPPVDASRNVFRTHGDHRMAMSLVPLAFCLPHIVIRDAEVVSKSYPSFWKDLLAIGFAVTQER